MSKSVTTRALPIVSRTVFEHLKSVQFRRQGNHLHRPADDLVHAVHFQGSQWGSARSGSFAVNLAVVSPVLYTAWTGQPFPSNPATASFPVSMRLGLLMPSARDYWWDVNESTDVPVLAAAVAEAILEYGLPFFEGFKSAGSVLQRLRRGDALPGIMEGQRPIIHAILAANAGAAEEAQELLARTYAATAVSAFRDTVRMIGDRLGVAVT